MHFILDCDGTPPRVAAPYHLIENTRYRVLIDHHRTSQPTFDVNWIDPVAIGHGADDLSVASKIAGQSDADIAQCLLCGLST
jgi:nanoRNase/pAp phosphatase (c-di-AMP/oligoRNAs hydrolase)